MKVRALLILLVAFLPMLATAQSTPVLNVSAQNAPEYYSIGAPTTLMARPPTRQPVLTRKLTTDVNFSYQCGEFNFEEDIERRFKQFADGFDSAADLMVAYIEGQIANLPIYLMQRWFPGAYETAQEFFDRYWAEYRLYLESCEATRQRILEGNGGIFEKYGAWAKAGKWQGSLSAGLTASETGELIEGASAEGAQWITGEKAGGIGQEPAKYVADTCVLGYQMLTENDSEAYIKNYFLSEDEIKEWCNAVLGEMNVSLVSNPENTPGRGLWALADEKNIEVQELLDKIVYGSATEADYELLAELTKGALPISRSVLEAAVKTNKQSPSIRMRMAYMAKQSVALNELQKALQAIRALRAASYDPVASSSGASDVIRDVLIPQIEEEMKLTQQLVETTANISKSIHENIMIEPPTTPTRRTYQNRPINDTRSGDLNAAGGDKDKLDE